MKHPRSLASLTVSALRAAAPLLPALVAVLMIVSVVSATGPDGRRPRPSRPSIPVQPTATTAPRCADGHPIPSEAQPPRPYPPSPRTRRCLCPRPRSPQRPPPRRRPQLRRPRSRRPRLRRQAALPPPRRPRRQPRRSPARPAPRAERPQVCRQLVPTPAPEPQEGGRASALLPQRADRPRTIWLTCGVLLFLVAAAITIYLLRRAARKPLGLGQDDARHRGYRNTGSLRAARQSRCASVGCSLCLCDLRPCPRPRPQDRIMSYTRAFICRFLPGLGHHLRDRTALFPLLPCHQLPEMGLSRCSGRRHRQRLASWPTSCVTALRGRDRRPAGPERVLVAMVWLAGWA